MSPPGNVSHAPGRKTPVVSTYFLKVSCNHLVPLIHSATSVVGERDKHSIAHNITMIQNYITNTENQVS